MTQRKLILLGALLLLAAGGIVAARGLPSFELPRVVVLNGGVATSANYSVHTVVGQPHSGSNSSSSFRQFSGFLMPARNGAGFTHKIWIPIVFKP